VRFAIISLYASSLSWWLRLQAEGHDVAVWVKPKECKGVGDGLVYKVGSFNGLKAWAKAGMYSGQQTIFIFDGSGSGEEAEDLISAGYPVVGGGKFMDRLEKDRSFGFEIAQKAGASLPPYEEFDSFTAALAFANTMDDLPVYFKSDRYLDSDATHGADNRAELVEYLEYIVRTYGGHGRCILQEKIKGVAISTARWWNGKDWVGPTEFTIEHKKFLNDDLGPSTGCCFNAVWFDVAGKSKLPEALGWPNLATQFRESKASPGLYDMNALVTPEGEAYFLEWTPRFGYDSEMTSARLFPNLGEWLCAVALGHAMPEPSSDLAWSVRLGVPPYPWEQSRIGDHKTCIGVPITGEVGDLWSGPFIGYMVGRGKENPLQIMGTEGIAGIVYAQGENLSSLNEEVLEAAKTVKPDFMSRRTDGDKVIGKDAKEIKKAGFAVHKGLLVD
jgi:phosphoribosylamine--glycine ligase